MFEIGFWEVVLIFALGLIVLGPEKMPKVAAQLGRYAGQARRMARVLTTQIRQEMELEESRAVAPGRVATPPLRQESATGEQPAAFSRPGVESLVPGQAEAVASASPPAPDADHPRES